MDERLRKHISEWFAKGDDDLYLASKAMQDKVYIPVGLVCFLCQQCAEKYPKGFLALHHTNAPKSHDLVFLVDLIKDAAFVEAVRQNANTLNNYSVVPRYPGDDADIPVSKAEEALTASTIIRSEVLKRSREAGYRSKTITEQGEIT